MTDETLVHILDQAEGLGTIEWIYFEGGEPSLFYERLCRGVRQANQRGFKTGIVTNASWATTKADAINWLQPFAGVVEDLSISNDDYHGSGNEPGETHIARQAAEHLGIPLGFISVTGPQATDSEEGYAQSPADDCSVLFRGRAAEKLADYAPQKPWKQFTECPWEELRHPERVHVDAFGHLHVCQGISIGNLMERPLTEIMDDYDPDAHPVVGPLLSGGPVELVHQYHLQHDQTYADACHLCYRSRCKLRNRFPAELAPDQMYGPG
jgi:hypothetical protein